MKAKDLIALLERHPEWEVFLEYEHDEWGSTKSPIGGVRPDEEEPNTLLVEEGLWEPPSTRMPVSSSEPGGTS